ncbi:hypothetical protein K438DRAFT_1754738 [Mycena galopus ATCC 62051]|nr:hypothetical protein K438DRAFT_1789665 [Mycena galopus ATCC 62051]KAF8207993.1 hypothetical protein K438DRAFT_1754738 [Mycena galopus ATCC 62051]
MVGAGLSREPSRGNTPGSDTVGRYIGNNEARVKKKEELFIDLDHACKARVVGPQIHDMAPVALHRVVKRISGIGDARPAVDEGFPNGGHRNHRGALPALHHAGVRETENKGERYNTSRGLKNENLCNGPKEGTSVSSRRAMMAGAIAGKSELALRQGDNPWKGIGRQMGAKLAMGYTKMSVKDIVKMKRPPRKAMDGSCMGSGNRGTGRKRHTRNDIDRSLLYQMRMYRRIRQSTTRKACNWEWEAT